MTAYPVSIGENVIVAGTGNGLAGKLVALHAGLKLRSDVFSVYQGTAQVGERVSVKALIRSVLAQYNIALADSGVHLRATAVAQLALRLAEHLRLEADAVAAYALAIHDAVRISLAMAGISQVQVKAGDTIELFAGSSLALGLMIREMVVVEESLSLLRQAVVLANEHFLVDAGSVPVLRSMVVVEEDVELSDTAIVTAIYTALLTEGLVFSPDVGPIDGALTTWAMNARTNAVTEYQNYTFNSFAQGDGIYLAAGAEGLYELVGNDDEGEAIIATLRNGIMELAGSNLAGLKAAYIAARGEGDFLLKLEGGGRTTIYKVGVGNLRTSRINLGKGWRARYMSWELTSTGQDFDLTGLTFLPITFTRRV